MFLLVPLSSTSPGSGEQLPEVNLFSTITSPGRTNTIRTGVNSFFLLPVQVDLGADVVVGGRHNARHDVVVVPATEVLVLEAGTVVHLRVELLAQPCVKHPVQKFKRVI